MELRQASTVPSMTTFQITMGNFLSKQFLKLYSLQYLNDSLFLNGFGINTKVTALLPSARLNQETKIQRDVCGKSARILPVSNFKNFEISKFDFIISIKL